MAFIDYYTILGVDKNAGIEDIRKAYRKLARKYHPDLNPNDEQAKIKFQEINEAQEVLTDPEKRKKYDQYGEHWRHGEAREQAQQQYQQSQSRGQGFQDQGFQDQDYSGSFDEGRFSDFFESLFGSNMGGGQQIRFKGQDYTAELSLTLREAYTTHQQTFTINGKKVRITVPAGIAQGQKIKLKGHGGAGAHGGPAGDLYITFHITPDPVFKRTGDDLYTTVDIDLFTALLGGSTFLDTFDGKIKLKINPETQNGTKVRLKGKGFPLYKKEGAYGDLYITYNVKLPVNLTEKQKELLKQLAEA